MTSSRRVALLIGVSQYGPGFGALPSSLKDIEEMQRVLENPEMGGFDDVMILCDRDRQTMESQIEAFFKGLGKDDTALFYFSGHGAKDESGKAFYLSTPITSKDAHGQLIEATAVAARTVHGFIHKSKCKRIAIILDCCFSAAFDPDWLAKGESSGEFARELEAEGRVILASSSAVESSFQSKGEEGQSIPQLSVYTRFLVEGMTSGAADQNEDGWISADELHEYAKAKVQTVAPAMNPQIIVVKNQGFKLAIARAPLGDPKLRYRKEVKTRIRDGKLSTIALRSLKVLHQQIGVSAAEAEAIEAELLQPFREYQQKLAEYQEAFLETIQQEYPLHEHTRHELQDFQQVLSLRDEDIQPIETAAIAHLNLPPPTSPSSRRDAINRVSTPYANFTLNLDNGITLDMIAIPGGTFLMGSPETEAERLDSEGPQHEVTIAPFYMGKFPVTQAQWRAIAALPQVNRSLEADPSHFKGDNLPVEEISWLDAVEFCDRVSNQTGKPYRLPREAEWEYACRAGTTTPFCFGDTISTDQANYEGNYTYGAGKKGEYREQTTPVGNFPANSFGLCDMHGNVWEWCQDVWHDNYNDAPIDGSVWQEGGVSDRQLLRGGSWNYAPRYCRSAIRSRGHPVLRNSSLGFRVACSAVRIP